MASLRPLPGTRVVASLALLLLAGCAAREPRAEAAAPQPGARVSSLLGHDLVAPPLDEGVRARCEAQLAAAEAALAADPDDLASSLRVGRLLGALNRFPEAVQVFSDGLERHPRDPWLLRFRGHRYITLRQFERAVVDLSAAEALVEGLPDQVEPSLPATPDGVDLDTLQENIHYHLALARYLLGRDQLAWESWRRCAAVAPNDDGRVMAAHWSAVAAARLQRPRAVQAAVADITDDLQVREYHAYHQLALMWKGERDGDALLAEARAAGGRGSAGIAFATLGYGVACWHRSRGEVEAAERTLDEVLASPYWQAFGYIAAETERARAAGAVD